MTVFTLYLGYMLLFTPNRPCVCGGVIKTMSWDQHIVFNCFFILLSLIAIRFHKLVEKPAANNASIVFT
jgi:hypothetical protein